MENEKEKAEVLQPVPQPAPKPAKKSPQFTFDRKTLALAVLAAISGVLSIFWGLWGMCRIGWAIAFVFYWISATVVLAERDIRPGGYAICSGLCAAALSAVFVLTDNPVVCGFSFVAMLLLAVVWFTGLRGQKVPAGDLALIPHTVRPIVRGVRFAPAAVRALLSGESDRKKRVVQALVGALCAVPVLAAVLPLLMRSDAAFEGLIGGIFVDFWLRFLQLILSLLLAALLFSFALTLRQVPPEETVKREKRGIATPALVAFLAVLSICYVAYLFSQLAYFFSAFSGILPADYTFSFAAYARRGDQSLRDVCDGHFRAGRTPAAGRAHSELLHRPVYPPADCDRAVQDGALYPPLRHDRAARGHRRVYDPARGDVYCDASALLPAAGAGAADRVADGGRDPARARRGRYEHTHCGL